MTNGNDKHLRAYEQILAHAKELLSGAKEDLAPKLEKTLELAREKASELGELSREETEKVSNYIRRDLHDFAGFFAADKGELKDWLKFDVELLEDRAIDAIMQLADPTKVDLAEFEEQANRFGEWRTGEITGPGTLICKACGEELHFHKSGHIPPCPKCNTSVFHR